jgi:predicted  nucleic acid-binding Zn-ribbon protein
LNKENYRILKEINSLNNSVLSLEKVIKNELNRISKIEEMRKKRSTLKESSNLTLKELRQKLSKIEERIAYFDNLINKGKVQLNQVFSENEVSALSSQIENAQNEMDEFEMQGLEIIEKMDKASDEIKNCTTFLEGSLETISEIEAEINESNHDVYKEIKTKKNRKEILFDQLPPGVSKKLTYLIDKGLSLAPLSQITDHNCCEMCGYLVPMAILSAVEKQSKFMCCPNCERILIPQSSKFL